MNYCMNNRKDFASKDNGLSEMSGDFVRKLTIFRKSESSRKQNSPLRVNPSKNKNKMK